MLNIQALKEYCLGLKKLLYTRYFLMMCFWESLYYLDESIIFEGQRSVWTRPGAVIMRQNRSRNVGKTHHKNYAEKQRKSENHEKANLTDMLLFQWKIDVFTLWSCIMHQKTRVDKSCFFMLQTDVWRVKMRAKSMSFREVRKVVSICKYAALRD